MRHHSLPSDCKYHYCVGGHRQRNKIHVTGYTSGADEHPKQPLRRGTPRAPACSEDYQSNVQIHCVREWTYLLKLLQYWKDANSLYKYGGLVWTEGKLMLFVFYHISEMLNPENLFIRLHEVMDGMPWRHHYLEYHSKEDCEAYFGDHVNIIQGLEHLRNWVKNWYLVEVRET